MMPGGMTELRMSSSETSSNTSSTLAHLDDDDSIWWDMGATVGVLAALASSSSYESTSQDAQLPVQELTGRHWVAINLSNSKKCYLNVHLHLSAFHQLHSILVTKHGLKSTNQYESIEALGMFLWACATRQSQRQMSERFGKSMDTVSIIWWILVTCYVRDIWLHTARTDII